MPACLDAQGNPGMQWKWIMAKHLTLNKGRVPIRTWTQDIEHEALQQLVNLSQLPILDHPIAAEHGGRQPLWHADGVQLQKFML